MQWLKRFGFYLVGVTLGSIIVLFIWKGKDVSFDYGMDARTLKTIRIKKRLFSEDAQQIMATSKVDTATISTILNHGDVDFGKSKPRLKPCAEYYITGKDSLKNINLYIIRCDSTATVDKIIIN
ncbi:DUF4258 domain-containing protein [Tenacibaculum crassostreae]|uniref:DUF4258 domain-containing protein n=1 Tax=Tenacibaculum crassostreae TaxID=502683 RepID=UPI003893CBF1